MKNLCKLLFCLFIIATSCSKNSPEEVVPVSGLQLNKHELRLEKGGSDVLAVTITPSNATDKTVSWVSTNPGVATVSDGIVIAVSTGTTEVIAKSGNYFDKCAVSVVIPATSINLNASKFEMTVGETTTLSATVLPKDATEEVEWSSSDESIATVDKGVISAIAEGETTISAKVGELVATCEVLVSSDKQTGDESGLLYGTWVLDTYRFETEGSSPVVVPYVQKTTLKFEEDPLVVYAHMGWETSQSKYTVDNDKKTIKLARMLEVSDDGQVLVMAGTFDIVELTETKLVLRQPYANSGTDLGGNAVTTKATATYTFHREGGTHSSYFGVCTFEYDDLPNYWTDSLYRTEYFYGTDGISFSGHNPSSTTSPTETGFVISARHDPRLAKGHVAKDMTVLDKGGAYGETYVVYVDKKGAASRHVVTFNYNDLGSCTLNGFYVNNTNQVATYASFGLNGAPAFGPGDWLKLTITGYLGTTKTSTVEVMLADYTGSELKLLKEWTSVETKDFGKFQYLDFSVTSNRTDVPLQACIDYLVTQIEISY